MDEYPSVCYLDVQKTGSTFVSAFLKDHLAEKRVRFQKHGRIRDGYDPRKLYFITCRHPLDQYRSLFLFGCAGEGMLRRRLDGEGKAALYERSEDGFAAWLGFMLDPANADLLGESYAKAPAGVIGFQTFRFLALAFQQPIQTLAPLKSRQEVRAAYAERRIVRRVLRTERLNAELADLARTDLRPFLRDADAALAALASDAKRNAARGGEGPRLDIPRSLRLQLEAREWFLFDELGYPRG